MTVTDQNFSTSFLLFAQYGGQAVIPLDDVCRDYFSHLTPEKLIRKTTSGEIALPVVRSEASQKSQRGVHLHDLARYLDARREDALTDFRKLHRP